MASAERQQLAERYAGQAVALLRKLQVKGYFKDANHLKNLQTDAELDSLRRRDDFVKLVTNLTKPAARK